MQPDSQVQPFSGSPDIGSNLLQRQIPWWSGLAPTAIAQLGIPPLATLPLHAVDVVVIGGGVAGLSAALSARAAGAQVLVLEREPILGYGATGRNAGILSAGINMGFADLSADSPGAAFWPETTRILLSLVEEGKEPDSILYARLTGAISLAESSRAARHLAREARARVAAGLQAEEWTPSQVAARTQNRLNVSSVVNALWLPDEGRIHPLTLLAHLARKARNVGILIAGQAYATAYKATVEHGRAIWHISLANGMHLTTRGLIVAVGPTAKPNARLFALAFAADLPETFPLFWDASPYTYADFRPGNGRLNVSGGRYGRAGAWRHDANYYQRLANAARRWLPELANQEPLYTWAVDIDVSSDMIPELRPIADNAPGVSIEGLGALGVLPGMALGNRAGQSIVAQI